MKTLTIKPHASGDINSFKVVGTGAAQNPFESELLMNHIKHFLIGTPIVGNGHTEPHLAEIKLSSTKSKKQIFVEVLSNHEDENGNIAIDVYDSDDDNAEGKTICWITADGKILLGQYATDMISELDCALVRRIISETIERQEERKQELIDKVLDQIREDINAVNTGGDITVLDELLKFIPCRNLMQSLSEEKEWENYPTGWSK